MDRKNKIYNLLKSFCVVFAILILICTIILCMDSINNKGIVPIIFFFLFCFNLSYYLTMLPYDYFKRNIRYKFKLKKMHVIEFIKFLLIIFMMYFTAIVYWS